MIHRRHFLAWTIAWTAFGGPRRSSAAAVPPPEQRRLVLVVFGGGVRSSETIDDPQHRYVPFLWKELVPRGTLWTNMRVQRRVVHPNCDMLAIGPDMPAGRTIDRPTPSTAAAATALNCLGLPASPGATDPAPMR